MSTIGTVDIAHESAVAIYDARTGEIVHRHEVVTVRGGEQPDDKAVERDARALFAQAHPGFRAATEVLHFDPRTLKPGVLHKVDVGTRKLVEVPAATRG